MTNLDLAKAYFDAWNSRDAGAIVETFQESGVYSDPTTNGPATTRRTAAYARTARRLPRRLLTSKASAERRSRRSRVAPWQIVSSAGACTTVHCARPYLLISSRSTRIASPTARP